ncbi:hypothetical protein ACFWN1_11490 [Streptomyces sp. NPDC058459]|uniref:hypothetical protein n=1 Tax=Streptomyces sp. NPDC058459 TaxID=3346508 RepID=UPI003652F106
MTRRSKPYEAPAWTRPGAQWGFWLCLSMLVLNFAVLVIRVLTHDEGRLIVSSAGFCVLFAVLFVANRVARRKRSTLTR